MAKQVRKRGASRNPRAAETPERAARRFVDLVYPTRVSDLINAEGTGTGAAWERLEAAVRKDEWPEAMTYTQVAALEEQLRGALVGAARSSDAFALLNKLSDAWGLEVAIAQEAGFLVGLAYARRGGVL